MCDTRSYTSSTSARWIRPHQHSTICRLLPAAIGEDGAYFPVTGSLPEFSIRNFARAASPPATISAAFSVSTPQVR